MERRRYKKPFLRKSLKNVERLVLVGRPQFDVEDNFADCLENLREERDGCFMKKIVEWIKGNAVEASILQQFYGKMFGKNDYLVEIK